MMCCRLLRVTCICGTRSHCALLVRSRAPGRRALRPSATTCGRIGPATKLLPDRRAPERLSAARRPADGISTPAWAGRSRPTAASGRGDERLEHRDARYRGPAFSLPVGQHDFGGGADDGAASRLWNSACLTRRRRRRGRGCQPPVGVLLERDRHRDFELGARAEPPLVEQLVVDRGRVAAAIVVLRRLRFRETPSR